jgi:tetratricopeptide (TPR) repeat protein
MVSPNQATSRRAVIWGIALALAVMVLVVYGQTWWKEFDFVNADDGDYVSANPHVKGGLTLDGIWWSLTAFHSHNWHPLTWLSLQLDSQLFGTAAPGYHRTNVLLHAANAVLLFLLLLRLTGTLWCSAAVAALFAIHPTHVESVAWVSERKDVLSTLFWLLTIWVYAWYAERPAVYRYLLVVLTFALGLMAKPMVVTLPAVLLLLDYWPLHRWPAEKSGATRYAPASLGRLIAEKVPLLCLVGFSVVLTLQAQKDLVQPMERFPLWLRVANALVAYVEYIGMMLWPINLNIYYPHQGAGLPSWQWPSAAVLLAGLTAVLLWMGRKRRYLAVGWLWYLGTLIPVIGLVQVASQALADRYTYVPTMGLSIIFAWGMANFCARGKGRVLPVSLFTGAALAVFVAMTWIQIGYWQNSVTLWRHVLAVNEHNHVAHNYLGLALAEKGQFAEAAKHFDTALRMNPHGRGYGYLGIMLCELGELDESAKQLERSIYLLPTWDQTRLYLGRVREQQGRHDDAVQQFTAALRIDSDLTKARMGLAGALANSGAFDQAREQIEILLRAEPDSALLYDELGRLYKRQGKLKEAVSCYDHALECQPGFHAAWNNKGAALEGLGQLAAAAECYRHAVEFEPEQLMYRVNLAYALRETGQREASATQYEVASRLQPDWPQLACAEAWKLATDPDSRHRDGQQALRAARLACQGTRYQLPQGLDALAAAHAELGQFDQAVTWERKALALLPDSSAAGLVDAIKERVRLYERRQPYRDAPTPRAQR